MADGSSMLRDFVVLALTWLAILRFTGPKHITWREAAIAILLAAGVAVLSAYTTMLQFTIIMLSFGAVAALLRRANDRRRARRAH